MVSRRSFLKILGGTAAAAAVAAPLIVPIPAYGFASDYGLWEQRDA